MKQVSIKRDLKVTQRRNEGAESGSTPLSFPRSLRFLGSGIMIFILLGYLAPDLYAHLHRFRSIPIRVFDNVLSEEACSLMHEACSSWESDNVLFRWPLVEPHKRSYIEQVINKILLELEGPRTSDKPKYYVEYWVRQKWHHTLAHADLDEKFFLQQTDSRHPLPDRYPIYGHVLYLKVGSQVNGPTVVFPNITKGGEMIRPNRDVELLICPAVPGRLLRFQGHLLHAVPRPADLWLYPTQAKLIHEPEEDFGRSVVLFNLWPIEEPPPMGRNFTGDTVDEENRHGSHNTNHLGNERDQWHSVSFASEFEGSFWQRLILATRIFQLPLMGPERRRGTKRLTLRLRASRLVEKAFTSQEILPKRVYLQQEDTSIKSFFPTDEL